MNKPLLLVSKPILGALAALAFATVSPAATLLTTSADSVTAVQLQGTTLAVSGLLPSGSHTKGINGYTAAEAPQYAIDGSTATKYLNFGVTNTGILIDPANDLLPLNAIQLTTANDSSERDPLTFSIYGTNVSLSTTFADYTPIILNQSITLSTTRLTASDLVTFANSTVYDSYLVIFPTVRDSATANSMQVSEIGLYSTVPEPSTWTALLSGAGILVGFRMRRRPA